jgi:hypothetical protein
LAQGSSTRDEGRGKVSESKRGYDVIPDSNSNNGGTRQDFNLFLPTTTVLYDYVLLSLCVQPNAAQALTQHSILFSSSNFPSRFHLTLIVCYGILTSICGACTSASSLCASLFYTFHRLPQSLWPPVCSRSRWRLSGRFPLQ